MKEKKSQEKKCLLGAHMSISGGIHKSIERAEKIGCTTMQIFSKNNKSWFAKPFLEEEIKNFKTLLKKSNLSQIMVHTSYLINLASSNKVVEKKSVDSLKQELERCEQLEIPYLVLHPGSHTGQGEEAGIKQVAKNLDIVLKNRSGKTKILLETMAGQGTSVGHLFEQLKKIITHCSSKKLVKVCLDTCHIFAAGYDIRTEKGFYETIEKFDKTLGISKLKAIHLNDSKTDFFSKKDRHENLFLGKIPKKIFKIIMNEPRFAKIPKILETPATSLKTYEKEIKMLKKMCE